MEKKHEMWELNQLQSLPLNAKIQKTKDNIQNWVNAFGKEAVYVSFSGGKDSTVLLDIAREIYPQIPAIFVDTGLEFPQIRNFVKMFDNVEILKPQMNFEQVIRKYGYPFISKEVSECVYGAKKYLTSIIESGILDQTDRQLIERFHLEAVYAKQHHLYQYEVSHLFGTMQQCSAFKNESRRIRQQMAEDKRIGRILKQENGEQRGRREPKTCNSDGYVNKRQEPPGSGECP